MKELDLSAAGKVWVGGATGFLGAQVAAQLISAGAQSAPILCSRSGGEVKSAKGNQQVLAVDILDPEAVEKSAQDCQSALLCAGMVSRDKNDAALLHQLHVEGTKTALLALKRAGVRRVVVASTSGTLAVGTDSKKIYDESSVAPLEHISGFPYYRSKYFGEQAALAFNDDDFEVIVVCPSLLLGPGDVRESSTGDVRKFLEKSVLATPCGGIAFVDVRDAAEGMLLALLKGRAGERYLLNAANMPLSTFFGRLSRISGVPAPVMSMPKNRALAMGIFGLYEKGLRAMGGVAPIDEESMKQAQLFWYCSSEKAEAELGFEARDPGETLRETVYDLFERGVVAPAEMRARSF